MMLWALPIVPLIAGLALWAAGAWARPDRRHRRVAVGAASLLILALTTALGVWTAITAPAVELRWGGMLALELATPPLVGTMCVLVPVVALIVALWAAGHEEPASLPRLLGLQVAFAGAMLLVVLAADLLTLAIGWELVGAISWALIQHRHRDAEATSAATYAFNATRLGGLGLFIAAGAALAAAGSFSFGALAQVSVSPWGHAFGFGILVAAAAKSAQLPFSPWLFRAMLGPSSVSALLHSSTMVAAGAWLLIRLHEPLAGVPWVGPAAIAIGLATALSGGALALVQPNIKRLLAASTSAQYGLMFAAVGVGSAGAALAYLVTHALFKALLFLTAGIAIAATGSEALGGMRLGRILPRVAAASAVGAIALAAIPPLGAAWAKEQIVAAAGHASASVAIAVIAAGGLSAAYAARLQLLAYGRTSGRVKPPKTWPTRAEGAAVGALAIIAIGLGALWFPAVHEAGARALNVSWPSGKAWELALSVTVAALAAALAYLTYRAARMTGGGAPASIADWWGWPRAIEALVTSPTRSLAELCVRLDDRVVDGGIRAAAALGRALSQIASRGPEVAITAGTFALALGTSRAAGAGRRADDSGVDRAIEEVARGVGTAGSAARRTQTGAVPTYYLVVFGGLVVLAAVAVLWSSR